MAQHDDAVSAGPGERLTQTQYAERRGWSKQYVNQLVKKGRIPIQGGRIDPAQADAALARDRDPAQDWGVRAPSMALEPTGSPATDPGAPQGTFTRARTVREHFRALRERLEYEQQAGKLVSAEQVEVACFAAARSFRDGFEAAAVRIGQSIAGKFKIDEREAIAITSAEIKTTLATLSRRFEEQCLDYKRDENTSVGADSPGGNDEE